MTDKKVPESFCRHAQHWPDLEDTVSLKLLRGAESSLHGPEHCSTTAEIASDGRRDYDQQFPKHSTLVFPIHDKKELHHQTTQHPVQALPEDHKEKIAAFQAFASD